jgi:TPR repeat protein
MLKYLDIARLLGAGIKCAACNGTRCRRSHWHTKQEKLGHQGLQPYRCEDCENRFFAASGASLERTLINGAAILILGIGITTAIELWPKSDDKVAADRIESASADIAKENLTRRPQGKEAPAQADKEIPATNAEENDPASDVALLRKAATAGHVGAMLHLGQILATGNGHPKDAAQAAKWMQVAAATGSVEGMFELGRYYRDGVGLPPNSVRAYFWLNRAATARHPSALHERDNLIRKMSGEELDEAHVLVMSDDWRDGSSARTP